LISTKLHILTRERLPAYEMQTERMKRIGCVWKQMQVDERLKIIREYKAKMEEMGVTDRALVG
jgi:hypothetical protein